MMRLAGFVIGCLPVLAALLLFLPDHGGTPPQPQAAAVPTTALPARPAGGTAPPPEHAPGGDDSAAVVMPPAEVNTPAQRSESPEQVVYSAGQEVMEATELPGESPVAGNASAPALTVPAPETAPVTRQAGAPGAPPPTGSSQRLWSPFRSRWAAEGFAQRLAAATDVPVEVEDAGPADYRVVLRYRDEGERKAMIAHIETVTGLDLE